MESVNYAKELDALPKADHRLLEELKFITWQDFGTAVRFNGNRDPSVSMKEYGKTTRFYGERAQRRLIRATQELLTLAKLYPFKYQQGKPYQFIREILDSVYETIIIDAEDRDEILRGQLRNATAEEKYRAIMTLKSYVTDSVLS
jgi:hypothetical protein|tara:strand:- start:803 stop:1237 length:435 start_codon:yes stop_codon:yes gene_type:complete